MPIPAADHVENTAPGPASAPLLGWRAEALRFFRNPIARMTQLRQRYGNVIRLMNEPHPPLILEPAAELGNTFFGFGPECNRQILTQAETFRSRRARGPKIAAFERLSDHILFMNGQRHADRRRLMHPVFTKDHLQAYYVDMVEMTEQMLERWRPGQRIDLLEEMYRLTMDIAAKSLLGLDPETARPLASRIRGLINMMASPLTLVPIDLPGFPYHRFRMLIEGIERELRQELDRKRALGTSTEDFLSRMIRVHDEDDGHLAGGRLSDEELMSQAFLMFFVGHDTTACALAWTFLLLALHPPACAELWEELNGELDGDPPSYRRTYELPVLDRVVKESLRVLCPTVVFPRFTAHDTALGEHDVPAGSEVLFSPYMTHLDPEIYPEADRFQPNRWQGLKPSPHEYLPFGGGPHKCIGASLGHMQVRLILSMMLQRFRLELIPRSRIDVQVVAAMFPKHGLPMMVRSQDRDFAKSKVPVQGDIARMLRIEW